MITRLLLYNLAPALSFISLIVAAHFTKQKNVLPFLRAASFLLAIYKAAFYIVKNARGDLTVPVEISAVSYFIVPVIVAFRIRRAYTPAAFLGIASGLEFFLFYAAAGFTVSGGVSLKELIIGIISHGYLFFTGTALFTRCVFPKKESVKIWLAMLAILCWALLFYDVEQRGITFIYYVIKPQFLFVFSSPSANLSAAVAYYATLCALFYGAVKLFFFCNNGRALSDGHDLSQTADAHPAH